MRAKIDSLVYRSHDIER